MGVKNTSAGTNDPLITKIEQETAFLDRLNVEHKELVEKKVKLQNFFVTKKFLDLPREEKDLLYEQERVMSKYIQILDKRIELACSKYKIEKK